MVEHLSFKRKVAMLVGVAMLYVIFIGVWAMWELSQRIVDGRRGEMVTAVQAAQRTALGYMELARQGQLSEADAKAQAMRAIGLSRFGGKDGKSEYFYIYDTQGVTVMHPVKTDWVGQNMIGKVKDDKGRDVIKAIVDGMAMSKDGTAFVDTDFPRPGQAEAVPKLLYLMQVEGWNWIVGSGLYMDDVYAEVHHMVWQEIGFLLFFTASLAGVSWLVTHTVLRQIGGDPAAANSLMRTVAEGDLTMALPPAPAHSLVAELSRMVCAMRDMVSRVQRSADSIAAASDEIAAGNVDLSRRTEQQASSLEQTTASMGELGQTVRRNADSAREANTLAQTAAEVATKGGDVVGQVVENMKGINEASRKIGDIIGVIDGIAFQTNILALNAAVEAARAGEQGRGFAVVAGEVRGLAQRSAAAAKEIKVLIGTSVERVHLGSKLVDQAGATMREMVGSIQRVTHIMAEISQASVDQSDGVAQVGDAVRLMDQSTQQNAALVQESAAAAEGLKQQSRALVQAMAAYKTCDAVA